MLCAMYCVQRTMDDYYQQHPIPQQISSYQFRLVGDMTLKQFFQVAGGALIALLIYSSGLPGYVKWPLILISFLFGVALAFFPVEDRPLSKWIYLFLKAIYSPTIYVWKQIREAPYFAPEVAEVTPTAPQAQDTQISGEVQATPESTNLEKGEQEFLSKVFQQFKAPAIAPAVATAAPQQVPQAQAHGQEVIVPKGKAVQVEPGEKEFPVISETVQQAPSVPIEITRIAGQQITTQQAQFSDDAAPPTPPTKPNVIVGQVLDDDKKILDGAILEIKDSDGRPVRALRSNKLGHFMIVTPLASGRYEIITDKEGYEFEPVTLEAQGQIIPPIAIQGKNSAGKDQVKNQDVKN